MIMTDLEILNKMLKINLRSLLNKFQPLQRMMVLEISVTLSKVPPSLNQWMMILENLKKLPQFKNQNLQQRTILVILETLRSHLNPQFRLQPPNLQKRPNL